MAPRRITPTLIASSSSDDSSNTSNLRISNEEDDNPYQEKVLVSSDIRNGSEPILKTNIDISLLFNSYGTTRRHNTAGGNYTFHVLPSFVTLDNSNPSHLNVVYEHRNYLRIASMTCPENIRNKLNPILVNKYKSFKSLEEFPSISESNLSINNYRNQDEALSIKEKLEIYGCVSTNDTYFLIAKDITNSLKALEFDRSSTFKRQVILIENLSNVIAVGIENTLVLVGSNTRVYMIDITALALQKNILSMNSFNIKQKEISLCYPTCIHGNQKEFYLGCENGDVIFGRFESTISEKQVFTLKQPVVSIFQLKHEGQERLLIVGTQKMVTTNVMNNTIFTSLMLSSGSSKTPKKKNFLTTFEEQSLVGVDNSDERVITCCLNYNHSKLATISTLGNVKIFQLAPSLELIFCANFKHTASTIQRGVTTTTTIPTHQPCREFECSNFCFARTLSSDTHEYLVLCTVDGLIYCFSPILL
ncbi:hypothetical protein C9374_000936 [Naegleria lovaniensis]|uniref:Uncharacterized protein n=1 Tax=Naegleria lovaniensis TaxID=51637 RepID=A0AA88GY37_NAELO|nr:uncharacterized protein C9374_000936 [Naegleria lovaniensis]KAG2388086.1 hypothetical protein C9374_000936 [Naegleria lovaniensis]